MDDSFDVIVDTKEKKPWNLIGGRIRSIQYKPLKTGDYTIAGLEDKICIERKSSAAEIAGQVLSPRFLRVLQRMQNIPSSFLVLEMTEEDLALFPKNLQGLPPKIKKRIKINGKFVLSVLKNYEDEYGVIIVFGENRANCESLVYRLFCELYDKYKNQNQDE